MSPRIQRWLFAPADPEAAAWLRIATAMFLPWCFASRDWQPALPAFAQAIEPLYASLFLTHGWWAAILIACALLGVGVWPRTAAAVLVPLLLPLRFLTYGTHSRHLMLVVVICLCFLRSGERLAPFARGPRRAAAGPLWPVRLLQLQLSLVYGVNALAKFHPAFWGGEVLRGFTIAWPNFRVDLADGFLHLGPLAVPAWLLAWATIATEAFLAIGWWIPRLRWPMAAFGVAFHSVVSLVVEIHLFGIATQFLYLAFLLPFERRSGGSPRPGDAREPAVSRSRGLAYRTKRSLPVAFRGGHEFGLDQRAARRARDRNGRRPGRLRA